MKRQAQAAAARLLLVGYQPGDQVRRTPRDEGVIETGAVGVVSKVDPAHPDAPVQVMWEGQPSHYSYARRDVRLELASSK